jgi:hypothetical protein
MQMCQWSRQGLLLVAIVSLTATACGNEGADDSSDATATTTTTTSSPTTSSPTTTTSPEDTTSTTSGSEVALAQACTNPEHGYRIRFPMGWSTNDGAVTPQCRFFHPDAFEVPPNTEVFGLAVTVGVDDVPFSRVAGDEGSFGDRELSAEETTVAGRRAERVEVEATGEALLPAGLFSYRYHVDLGDRTLIATTHAVNGLDYEANKKILDQMMQSLELGDA